MNIQISDHFTYKKLLLFVLPSIGMMIFTSIYTVVDGYFVSNYAGSVPFAAINIIAPFLFVFSAIGFMIGTGGTALVSYNLGLQNKEKANEIFSLLIYTIIICGLLIGFFGQFVLKDISILLGATDELLPYCIDYGRIFLWAMGAFMLQTSFQSFLVAAERPKIGFYVTLLAGMTNIILDYVLVGILSMGVIGAALATSFAQLVGGMIPLIYFILPNQSLLRIGKAKLDIESIKKTCSNGFSEFVSNTSMNVVAMVYNLQLLRFIGEQGVSAYGVIMYVCFIFLAVYIGYSIGVAPIVGYHYGADHKNEIKNLLKKSIIIIGITSVLMFIFAEGMSSWLSEIYVGYDHELYLLTRYAFRVYSFTFLLMGFNIFGSAFFTALNNGKVSATISILRTFVFQIICVLILPVFFKVDGIWLANIFAEALSIVVTVYFIIRKKKQYGY